VGIPVLEAIEEIRAGRRPRLFSGRRLATLAAVGQSHLMQSYDQLFAAQGIVIAQTLLTKRDLSDRVGYLNARNTLLALLELRAVPIVNENDVVAVEEIEGAKIGDNDNLSALVANLVDADLLVLGARGAGFMRHLLLGATAERLLRKTLRPLLVVRQVPHERYRRVLVPVDFSPWTQQSLRMAQAVAPDAEIILCNAYQVPFEGKLRYAGVLEEDMRRYLALAKHEAQEALQQAALQAGLKLDAVRLLTVHGAAAVQILQQEEELDVDLIVMGKHGTGITEELLLGSATKHVLAEARCDVMIAHR